MYMTFFLTAAMAGVFAWQLAAVDPAVAVLGGALVPYNLTHDVTIDVPVWLTLLSSVFLHAGLLHIASNALVFLAVGPAIEQRCGDWRFLLFFLLCGMAGGLAQTALDPGSHRPIIGASGAISGVLAAFVMRYPLAETVLGIPVAFPILAWAGFQCLESGLLTTVVGDAAVAGREPIAYAAHVGGFVIGALAIGLFEKRRIFK